MIVDKISNAADYYGLSNKMKRGLEYLQQNDFSQIQPGKYEIEGADIYALVGRYTQKPSKESVWEAHKKYADIQYVFSGSEKMGYACICSLCVTKEYDDENDYYLLEGSGDEITCNEGTFVVFMPQDAHIPCMVKDDGKETVKVVVKIKLD